MAKRGDPRVTVPWRQLRRRILDADDTCHICHHPGSDTVDHLIPIAAGGDPLDPDNLAPAHRVCNSRKGAKAGSLSPASTPAPPGEVRALRRVSPWSNEGKRTQMEVNDA